MVIAGVRKVRMGGLILAVMVTGAALEALLFPKQRETLPGDLHITSLPWQL